MTDDQGADTLPYMPNVQQGLIAQGRTVDNFVYTFPLCCLSGATVQTGKYPHNTGVVHNEDRKGGFEAFARNGNPSDTVAAWVNAEGYRTGYFGKYLNGTGKRNRVPGWDTFHAFTGRDRYERGFTDSRREISRRRSDAHVATRTLGFLRAQEGSDEPFFAFAGFYAPHSPYYHPKRTDRMFRNVGHPQMGGAYLEADMSDKPPFMRKLRKPKKQGIVFRDQL